VKIKLVKLISWRQIHPLLKHLRVSLINFECIARTFTRGRGILHQKYRFWGAPWGL